MCTTDNEQLVCFRGREPNNRCGGCGRCILAHAYLDDGNFGGVYVNAGTLALIEDVGGSSPSQAVRVVFDPLLGGPGLDGLPSARVTLAQSPDAFVGGRAPLEPVLSSALAGVLSDPARSYSIPAGIPFSAFSYLVIVEDSGLLNTTIAAGQLILGPPDEIPGEED